jgi:PEP-CTERM motif
MKKTVEWLVHVHFYWIDVASSSDPEDSPVNWGYTSDVSGVGVAENYNSSNATDFTFFRNQGLPPFPFDLAFQMKISGVATPEPSTWAMMALGFAGLGLAGYRRDRALRAAA